MTSTIINRWEVLDLLEDRRLERIRGSLHKYCRYIDIPGAPLNDDEDCDKFYIDSVTPAKHHDLLNDKLMRLADPKDELNFLLVFMPPGSAKSTYATVTFPTWWMGNNDGEPVICASYGSTLAKKFGRKCRQITASEKYNKLYGHCLKADNRAADDWSLTNGSSYMCGGINSGMTGNRAGLIVIDDPVRGRDDADSEVIRDKTWDAYVDDIRTRAKPGAPTLIIQTRWHEDDLSGRILPKHWDGESGFVVSKSGEKIYVLSLEAECTREDDPLGRGIGEFLWPDWFSKDHWIKEKNIRGSRNWAALYQQRPKPGEGALIQRAWIKRYDTPPAEFIRIVHSWDTASKDKEINDPSVCTVWGETRHGYYLLYVFRERLVFPDLKRAVVSQALKWLPLALLVEDKSSGMSLIQELRQGVDVEGELFSPPVVAIDPLGVNKTDRLVAVSPLFEAGMVYLPNSAPWLTDYEMELFGFPLTTHDDQVDSTSQFLKWAHSNRVTIEHHSSGQRRVGLQDDSLDPADDFNLGIGGYSSTGGFI